MSSLRALLILIVLLNVRSLGYSEVIHVFPDFQVEYGEVIEGDIAVVDVDGITLETTGSGLVQVPWFAVDDWDSDWKIPIAYQDIAKKSRIGYARYQRGDLSGCADLYRSIAVQLVGSQSRLASAVFHGLLDDALVRADFVDAAVALRCLQMSRTGSTYDIDDRYGVHIGLPMIPSGTHDHYLLDLVEKLDELNNEDDTMLIDRFISLSETIDKISVSDHISDLFTKEASLNSEETALGKELYLNMYTAQMHSDPEMRERSRNWLQSRAESKNGSWIDLWCRLAIGHSYLRESALADDDTACSLGVIQLLHASLRFGDDYPLLAQFARRTSAEALRKRARYEEAAKIFLGIDD